MFGNTAEDYSTMALRDTAMLKSELKDGDSSAHSECRVYKAKRDGTPGRFLRIECPEPIQYHFTSGRRTK